MWSRQVSQSFMGSLRAGDEGRRSELLPELADGPEKIAFDRPDGQAERFGDILEHELVVVAEDKDGLFLGRDFLQGAGDPVLELSRFQVRGGVRGAPPGQAGLGAAR